MSGSNETRRIIVLVTYDRAEGNRNVSRCASTTAHLSPQQMADLKARYEAPEQGGRFIVDFFEPEDITADKAGVWIEDMKRRTLASANAAHSLIHRPKIRA